MFDCHFSFGMFSANISLLVRLTFMANRDKNHLYWCLPRVSFNVYLNFFEHGKLLFVCPVRTLVYLQVIKEQSLAFPHMILLLQEFWPKVRWLLSLSTCVSFSCFSVHGQSERGTRASEAFFTERMIFNFYSSYRKNTILYLVVFIFPKKTQIHVFFPKEYFGCVFIKLNV